MSELNDNEFKTLIYEKLVKGNVKINFTKKDGSLRDMICTLINIPEDKKPKEKESDSESKYTTEALRVFDVEKQDWRAFRLDSVNSVTLLD